MKRLIRRCTLVLIFVLLFTPSSSTAQSQEKDKGLSPRVSALEKKLHEESKTLAELTAVAKSLEQRMSQDVELFKEISNATIRVHEETLSTITTVGSLVSLCVTVIGLALGILGFKEFVRLRDTANKAKQISEDARKSAANIETIWNTIKTDRKAELKAVGDQADRVTIDVRALEAVTRNKWNKWGQSEVAPVSRTLEKGDNRPREVSDGEAATFYEGV